MKVERTSRGFERVEFLDHNNGECSLQQSSGIDDTERGMNHPGSSFVWLGRNDSRMHLDRKQVEELIELLGRWVDTGYLAESANE